MKGAYIARIDLSQEHLSGVAAKIEAQAAALKAMPSQVDLFFLRGSSVMRNGDPIVRMGAWRRIAYYFSFYIAVARYLAAYDFLYIRYQGTSPIFLWMLGHAKARRPDMTILVEIPTFPYEVRTTARDQLLAAMNALLQPKLHRHVTAVVTFSKADRIFGIPTIRTDNGVDMSSFHVAARPVGSKRVRLLGLANLSFWHGYDRVIAGLAAYYAAGGRAELFFDVVGVGAELPRLQAAAEHAGLAERIVFHGSKRGPALDAICAQADIAFSSIGFHRVNFDTSTLKSREFCARGIPFVFAYEDRDFGADFPFALRIEASDAPVSIADVLAFHERLASMQEDVSQAMRSYALRNLTWASKMAPVCKVLLDLHPGSRASPPSPPA